MFKFYNIIFFFIPYHKIGGAERVHLNIIKSLKNKPFVFFDNCNYLEIGQDFKDNAYCFSIASKKRRKYLLKFIHVISAVFKMTLFGCNTVTFYDFIGCLKGKVKAIDLTHAFSFPNRGIEMISLPYVDLIDRRVVINTKTLEDYKKLYIENNINEKLLKRFTIIPNGIEINKFDSSIIDSRWNNFTIGFVGRNSPEKRPELFFDVIKKLKVNAKAIGDNFNQFKREYPNVIYFENCNDEDLIRKQFSDISVLIVTSSREGFPLVIMEAMELGIPVIATDVGSIFEHLQDSEKGFLGPVDSEMFLDFASDKISAIMEDKEWYTTLSLNARRYAEDNFSIEKFNSQYKTLFYE